MIKYRVWSIGQKCYLERSRKFDYYIDSYGALNVSSGWDSYKDPTYEDDTDQDRYIVEQFTGLTDKNGVDIYEGDWMTCADPEDDSAFVVIFENGAFRKDYSHEFHNVIDDLDLELFEVTGNIHG